MSIDPTQIIIDGGGSAGDFNLNASPTAAVSKKTLDKKL